MPLTLVLGPANSAKAGEVLGAYAAASPRGAILVVPTLDDADIYGRELAGRGAPLGGSVLTFTGLVRELARRSGYAARLLSMLQRERVTRRVIGETRLDVLCNSAAAPGFVAATMALIAELERSMITPQRFAQALRTWAAGVPSNAVYAEELGSLYLGYERALRALGRVDPELFAWRALDALRAAPASWGTTPIFLYGFDDLTPLERDAIETLSRIAGAEVTVSLTYEPGRQAFAARAALVEELRPLAARVRELEAVKDNYAPAAREALHELERRLFESAPLHAPPDARGQEPIEPGDAVRLLEAGGERAEAELVAAEIVGLMRGGVPGEEIAVVHRSLQRSAGLFERVLTAAGVAVATKGEVPLNGTSLGRSLLALARCALVPEELARAQDLVEYLRSPGVLEHLEIADALEREIRTQGLRTAAEARARLRWRLAEIDALAKAVDPHAELARQAARLLAAPHGHSAPILEDGEELDARALAVVLGALSELDELGARLAGPELIELLEGLMVPTGGPSRPGAVLLAEPLAIRARRFRAVFVCGLQEGEFPLLGTAEPFLSDERRRELAIASGLRLRPREDALARERYLFYACVSRASERVYLSYRSSDEEGNIALRSPFIADVAELLVDGWAERRRRRLLADVVWDPREAPTARELARAAAADASLDPDTPARVLTQSALAHVRHRDVWSPGALESYADCPVKWLVQRELQPAWFEPEPEPIARGNYMHAALESVLRRLGTAVTKDSLPAARQILERVLSELEPSVSVGATSSMRDATLRAIAADLRRYLEHEAGDDCGWDQAGLELRFGFEHEAGVDSGDAARSSLPALEIGHGEDLLRVRGMIDRVDTDGKGHAIVRDYKSGSRRDSHRGDRWRDDRNLQVALYMIAVRELLGLEPVAGVYQPLAGSDIRARGVALDDPAIGLHPVGRDSRDRQALTADLDDAAARAIVIAGRLRAGELTPSPETCSRHGCAHPGICRAG